MNNRCILFMLSCIFATQLINANPKEIDAWSKNLMTSANCKEHFKNNPNFLKDIPLSDYSKQAIKNNLRKAIASYNKHIVNDLNNLNLEQMLLVYHIVTKAYNDVASSPALHSLYNSLPVNITKNLNNQKMGFNK